MIVASCRAPYTESPVRGNVPTGRRPTHTVFHAKFVKPNRVKDAPTRSIALTLYYMLGYTKSHARLSVKHCMCDAPRQVMINECCYAKWSAMEQNRVKGMVSFISLTVQKDTSATSFMRGLWWFYRLDCALTWKVEFCFILWEIAFILVHGLGIFK